MQAKYLYLLVDIACLFVPLMASFHPKIRFYKLWKAFLMPCLLTAAFFLVWDGVFTKLGIWSFNPRYVSGIYLANLPIEEVLFFICIPYACTFTYYCIKLFVPLTEHRPWLMLGSRIFAVALLLLAIIFHARLYTSVTFTLLAIFLIFFSRSAAFKATTFYLSFLIIIIPFVLSNGILTGAFTEQPVVIYNNNYNLGVRIMSIPIEDIFYAMLLLSMNIYGFELATQYFAKPKEQSGLFI